jgi:hypothetical protein
MAYDARIENRPYSSDDSLVEVHTESGIDLVRPNHGWKTWLALSLILVAVVVFFVWIGVAGASAPGGCGGG